LFKNTGNLISQFFDENKVATATAPAATTNTNDASNLNTNDSCSLKKN
jgi:hypothetical protein